LKQKKYFTIVSVEVDDDLDKILLNFPGLFSNASFDIKIHFSKPIIRFRNHNYRWDDLSQTRIANDFSPKTIQLQNGFFVQANINLGIWEIDEKNPSVLWWRFNPEFAAPITQYSNELNTKKIIAATTVFQFSEPLALLFSKESSIELSRAPIPFAAIACFTDHCDFDTSENLKIQREFLKSIALKTTKGFFLNHFSKRDDNASFEKDVVELRQWRDDGHELCYHSLSQSIKSEAQSFSDFLDFEPPYSDLKVWIDHGFQPYNFSLFAKNNFPKQRFDKVLVQKNIEVLWNYIDAATATKGIINQLDYRQFNLENYTNSIKELPFFKRTGALIKNIIFHYDNDEFRVRNYIETITHTKSILKKGKIQEIFNLFKNSIPLVLLLLKVFFTWNKAKKRTYKVAKYSPLFFKHKIVEKEFYIFQAIEMVDFNKALCKENIDSLVAESGVFIAHTYFSVNMSHYQGKLINADQSLNETVVQNFNYLAQKVAENVLWNPTLSEFLAFYKDYQKTVFDIDEKGVIFIKNNFNIPSRIIQ
jgi:hypothetical protein